MLNTTVGQLLINDALPEELRDYSRVLDKKGVHSLLQQVARQHPDKYRDVSFRLNQIGQRAAQDQGGMSFGLRHLKRSKVANDIRQRIQGELRNILADDSLTDQQRTDRIIRVVGRESSPQQKAVLEEAIASGNPLGMQVLSGSRGKPMNLASLLAADMLYSDHRDEVIPIPVLRSYSEGLSPEEYWAGTYGARRGIIATKFATQEAGFLSKQLNQAGHRLVVMGEDGEADTDPEAPARGMIVDTGDMDNEGALLARDAGPYKKNTPLTPKILKQLDRMGMKRILVRSPLVGGSPEGGVYARDVGIRENGTLPGRGEQVGLQAAQALSEPISQGQLSAKHSGGVAGQEKAVGGFQYINQLIQVPKKMQGGASHATVDGTVQRIEPAPAGGHFVTINGEKHYVGEGFEVKVKKGDEIEAGDMLSDGIPNPAIITQYKGVGEGRRYFVNEFRKAMAASGMQGHRRNIELLARGLINHVQLTEETDDHAPDDIIPYSTLEHTYKPREGHERLIPKKAVGQYLEAPVLHYTIGTKIRPSMLKDFEEFGVNSIPVHKNPPPFQPHMVRGMYQLQHDPDWMTQMYGSGLKKSLLESVARGATSEERGTSFVPSLATGTDFGDVADRAVVKPHAPYQLPKVEVPELPEPPSLPKQASHTFFGGRYKLAEEPKSQGTGLQSTPKPKRLSADQLASQPRPVNRNVLGQAKTWQPGSAGVLPPGEYNQANNVYTNKATGQQFDRYKNPVGGTYSEDGRSWMAGEEQARQFLPADNNIMPQNPAEPETKGSLPTETAKPQANPVGATPPQAQPPRPPAPVTPAQSQTDHTQVMRSMGLLAAGGGPTRRLATSRDPQVDYAPSPYQSPFPQIQPPPRMPQMPSPALPATPPNLPASPPPLPEPPSVAPPDPLPPPAPEANGALFLPPAASFEEATVPPPPAETSEAAPSTGKQIYDNTMKAMNFGPEAIRVARTGASPVANATGLSRVANLGRAAAQATEAGAEAATAAKATGMLGTAGKVIGKAAVPIGVALESVNVGSNLYNKGWDQTTNDTAQKFRDILSFKDGLHTLYQAPLQVLSPVENVQMIAGGVTQTAGGLYDAGSAVAGAGYDLVTGTDSKSRAADADRQGVQKLHAAQQEEFVKQRDQLLQEAERNQTMSPQMKQQLQQQAAEADAQANDAKARIDAANDETATWRVGKQNWVGSGGHKFRDAISNTAQQVETELAELQGLATQTPEQKARIDRLAHQKNEYNNLLTQYNREVGYFGTGGFDDYVRNAVQGKKRRIVDIGQALRSPQAQKDPAYKSQLEQERADLEAGLTNYRGWAEQAK